MMAGILSGSRRAEGHAGNFSDGSIAIYLLNHIGWESLEPAAYHCKFCYVVILQSTRIFRKKGFDCDDYCERTIG
jgi:hypothetical protein